jgi:hypothetical protein
MMGWLFILALILAWPTFGLSILFWLVLAFIQSKGRAKKMEAMRESKTILDPLFDGRFDDFFLSLDLPLNNGVTISREEAGKCGRHIVNFIAYNPEETELFIRGLKRWRGGARARSDSTLCDPIQAAKTEVLLEKAEVHLSAYRAMEAISLNNKNLSSFQKLSIPLLRERITVIEEALDY